MRTAPQLDSNLWQKQFWFCKFYSLQNEWWKVNILTGIYNPVSVVIFDCRSAGKNLAAHSQYVLPRAKYFPIRPYHPVNKDTILWWFVLLVRDKLRFCLELPMFSWDIESTTTTFSVLNSHSSRWGTKNLFRRLLPGSVFWGATVLHDLYLTSSTSTTTCLANGHALKYHIGSCVWATRKYWPWSPD